MISFSSICHVRTFCNNDFMQVFLYDWCWLHSSLGVSKFHKQNMTEAADTMVENTQLCKSGSLQEREAEDKCLGGVGITTTIHPINNTNSRKCPNDSSLENVRIHSHSIIWLILEVMIFSLHKQVGFVKYVECLDWNLIIICWARRLISTDGMYVCNWFSNDLLILGFIFGNGMVGYNYAGSNWEMCKARCIPIPNGRNGSPQLRRVIQFSLQQ